MNKTNKTINLLFDATVLTSNFRNKDSSRTGICLAYYNILKEMLKDKRLNIYLYDNNWNYLKLEELLEELKIYNFKILNYNKKIAQINAKLIYLKNKNKRTKNKRTQTLFMIFKRTVIKIIFYCFHFILNKSINRKIIQGLENNPNIYFSAAHSAPNFILKNKRIKKYILLHDTIPSIFPEFYPDIKVKTHPYNQLISSINKDDYYFANSENTRQDFLKYVSNISPDKIITTYVGANENFYRCEDKTKNLEIRKKYNIPEDKKYIFSLCTLEPRKNLIFAVKNFVHFANKYNIEDLVFVLAGGYWEFFIDKLNKEIDNLSEYKNKIIKTGYIDDEDLASLYSNAEMFVYPSLYEGFGSPPLEAMQCGCPVITSNVSSIPEVVGDAAIMINPKNDEELINAYKALYYNESLRKELSQKGMERAKLFSWSKSVNIMINEMLKNQNME